MNGQQKYIRKKLQQRYIDDELGGRSALGAMVDRPYLLTSDPPPPPPIEVRVAPIERPIYYSAPPSLLRRLE